MVRARGNRTRWRRAQAGLAALAALLLSCVVAPPASAAAYEPNDSVSAAAGPLLAGQTYEAALDTSYDRDFFYFYVTSPDPTSVTITIRNLGADADATAINAYLVDGLGTPLSQLAYFLAPGGEASGEATLEAGRYFLEFSSSTNRSEGTSYSVTGGGEAGAFGPYSAITSRCARGEAALRSAKRGLSRAQSKLQRAAARLRQSRFGSRGERMKAVHRYRRVKSKVVARRDELETAKGLVQPWCSI